MRHRPPALITGAILGLALLILLIQVFLFETVLGASLDGLHGLARGAFWVSLPLTLLALFLAFLAPRLDKEP